MNVGPPMRTRWEVMTECGYITVVEKALGEFWTDLCPIHRACGIAAIETREWHVKCHTCKYARWAGASQSNARIIERKHLVSRPGHNTTIDFITPDNVREMWRKIYGKRRTPRRFLTTNHDSGIRKSIYASSGTKGQDNASDTDTCPF